MAPPWAPLRPQHWSDMRHSAWTLWLVPLALPLVLVCIPGSRDPLDSRDWDGREAEAHEVVQTDLPTRSQHPAVAVLPPHPTPEERTADPTPG
jgi:hypothetical protein